jgi:hypothetical protein
LRAARDFCSKESRFAATVALFAVTHLLAGGGYDPPVSETNEAITSPLDHLIGKIKKDEPPA